MQAPWKCGACSGGWAETDGPGPLQSSRHVTVRNVFLEDGNLQAGVRMGEVMLEVGIKKIVGQSSVVLHGHAIP